MGLGSNPVVLLHVTSSVTHYAILRLICCLPLCAWLNHSHTRVFVHVCRGGYPEVLYGAVVMGVYNGANLSIHMTHSNSQGCLAGPSLSTRCHNLCPTVFVCVFVYVCVYVCECVRVCSIYSHLPL